MAPLSTDIEDKDIVFNKNDINNNPSSDNTHEYISDLFADGNDTTAKSDLEAYDILGIDNKLKVQTKDQLRLLLELAHEKGQLQKGLIPKIDTSEVTDMSGLFMGIDIDIDCSKPVDLSEWDVSNVENMCMMFYNTNIKFTGLKEWNVSKVRNMRWMMEDTLDNKDIVDCWEKKKYLKKDIEKIYYPTGNKK